MITLADVLRRYGPAYVQKYGASMPQAHRRALELLPLCRSGDLGYALYHCAACGTFQPVPRSCGNRHCPTCQGHKTQQWLRKQMRRRLPCPYSGLVERLPAEPAEPLPSPVVPCPKCGEPMELVRPQLALPIAPCDSG
jgi:hypothetical protein